MWSDSLPPWSAPDNLDDYILGTDEQSNYHAVSTIQLGELIEAGFYKPEEESWKFKTDVFFKRNPEGYVILGSDGYPTLDEKRNEELYDRLIAMFIDRHYFDEICDTPPSKWKNIYTATFGLSVLKQSQIYRFNDEFNIGARGNNWSKRRHVNSDFPATVIENRIEDYARDAQVTEWESLKRDTDLNSVINGYDKWRNPDEAIMLETDKLFTQIYTHSMNGY